MWTFIDVPDLNVYSLISSPHFIVEVFVSFGLLKNTVITSLEKGSKKVGYFRRRTWVETVFRLKWDLIQKKNNCSGKLPKSLATFA